MGFFSKNRGFWSQLRSRQRRNHLWETAAEFPPEDDMMFSEFDPFGSYTGVSMDDELPEQDVDDM